MASGHLQCSNHHIISRIVYYPRQSIFVNDNSHSPSSCARGHLCLPQSPWICLFQMPLGDRIIRHLPACLCPSYCALHPHCCSTGCLRCGAIIIGAAMMMGVWIVFQISAFRFVFRFWGEYRGWISGPSGNSLFNFLRNCQSFCVSLI